jgi:DNA (cytosine-5)-methyltransferase 1
LPTSGSMRSGALYGRPMLEPRIGASVSSSWPTPTARDWKDGAFDSDWDTPVNGLLGRLAPQATGAMSAPNSGPLVLNPTFVEWMMGFPRGWTGFGPLETRWFHNKPRTQSED